MALFCPYTINGLENLKTIKNKQFIIASNHIHEFDPAILPSVLPLRYLKPPTFFVSLPGSFYNYERVGWRSYIYSDIFFKMWGAHPVFKGLKNYKKSLEHILKILEDGGNVYIFPEGGYTRDGSTRDAKGGIGYLSYSTGVPVLPIKIDGIWKMGLKDFFFRKRRFSVSIGKLIYPNEIFGNNLPIISETKDDYQILAQYIVEKIKLL